MSEQWRPSFTSTQHFLSACLDNPDPFGLRYVLRPRVNIGRAGTELYRSKARYETQVSELAIQLPVWKQERLPPPRVSQSQYDKVGLTRKHHTNANRRSQILTFFQVLQWIWTAAHGPHPNLVFPYVLILL